jgi:antagonist of KipI
MLKVLKMGGFATIQDGGRTATRKYGIPAGGFMDIYNAHSANQMVGNNSNLPLIELFDGVMDVQCQGDQLIAITGAKVSVNVDDQHHQSPCTFNANYGQLVSIGSLEAGHVLYVAIAGGIDTTKSYGSSSTFVPCSMGGNKGEPIRVGDQLKIGAINASHPLLSVSEKKRYHPSGLSVRFKKGPEFSLILPESQQKLMSETFSLGKTNRVGYRLDGPKIQANVDKMSSRFVTRGTVQLSTDGNPIVLMSDSQTTGGYPRIAQIYEPDIDYLTQMKSGARIRFREII